MNPLLTLFFNSSTISVISGLPGTKNQDSTLNRCLVIGITPWVLTVESDNSSNCQFNLVPHRWCEGVVSTDWQALDAYSHYPWFCIYLSSNPVARCKNSARFKVADSNTTLKLVTVFQFWMSGVFIAWRMMISFCEKQYPCFHAGPIWRTFSSPCWNPTTLFFWMDSPHPLCPSADSLCSCTSYLGANTRDQNRFGRALAARAG